MRGVPIAKGDKAEKCHLHPQWCLQEACAVRMKFVLVFVLDKDLYLDRPNAGSHFKTLPVQSSLTYSALHPDS